MSKPKVKEQKPTAQEIAQFDIAQQQWAEYRDTAPPLQEMYQRLTTGWTPDGEGGLQQTGHVLNDDGSVRTDTGQVQAQAAQAWDDVLQAPDNPNKGAGRMGRTDLLEARLGSEAKATTGSQLQQQNNYLQGVENVISMGRGQQASALTGMQQQAGVAANEAAQDAQKAFADKSANRYLAGSVLGAAGGYLGYQNANKQNPSSAAGGTPGINPAGGMFNFLRG